MFIGHIPAGYVFARAIKKHITLKPLALITIVVIASVFPDLDLLYFYTIDQRQHLHHSYWFHLPIFWIAIYAAAIGLAYLRRSKFILTTATFWFLLILLHLVLDSITGGILWLYPLNAEYYRFVDIPAVHGWWVLNFVLHWTFLIEIACTIFAIFLMLKKSTASGV